MRPWGLEPESFRSENISAASMRFNEDTRSRLRSRPGPWELGPARAREAMRAVAAPPAREAYDIDIGGGVSLHIVPAPAPLGICLHIHGGGMVLGSASLQDGLLARIAREAHLTVASVEYRLAPEHPYPAAWDDCERAAIWLIELGRGRLGADLSIVAGESAGALLSVATMVRLRDAGGWSGLRGAVLSYGVYDTSMTPSQLAAHDGLLTTADIRQFAAAYAPDPEMHRHPEVSPLYARLEGLPCALFTIGARDAMRDDSLFMYTRWIAAGNAAEIAVYPGADHGFLTTPHPQADAAQTRLCGFIADCVAGP